MKIPDHILNTQLETNLAESTIKEISTDGTLFVFLRQLGCVFCREFISVLKSQKEIGANFPKIVFVCHGSVKQATTFFDEFYPNAQFVCDKDEELYKAFDLKNGNIFQLVGPKVIYHGIRLLFKGETNKKTIGNPRRLSGLFYLNKSEVKWAYYYKNASDHPSITQVLSAIDKIN